MLDDLREALAALGNYEWTFIAKMDWSDFPAPHFWFSGATLFTIGSFALFAFLGLLGIAMSVTYRRWMIGGFIFASILFFLGWWQAAKQERDNANTSAQLSAIAGVLGVNNRDTNANLVEKIADALKGGDSFCYFYADLTAPRDNEGGFPRIFANSGNNIPWIAWWVYAEGAQKNYYSDPYKNSPYRDLSGHHVCPP